MNTRKKYPKEFKLDAVSLVLDQSYTRIEAAKSLGINSTMLGLWVKEHERSSDGQAFRGYGKLTPEQTEIRQLREGNRNRGRRWYKALDADRRARRQARRP